MFHKFSNDLFYLETSVIQIILFYTESRACSALITAYCGNIYWRNNSVHDKNTFSTSSFTNKTKSINMHGDNIFKDSFYNAIMIRKWNDDLLVGYT
jgi:hypothetical protein